MLSRSDVFNLGLDARALFVFGFVNDCTPVLDLLTMSGMPMPDAADVPPRCATSAPWRSSTTAYPPGAHLVVVRHFRDATKDARETSSNRR